MIHRAPFLIPFLIPKDIATKTTKDRSGTQLYHRANFHADRHHRRRDSPSYTKNSRYR